MLTTISDCTSRITPYLPTPKKAALASIGLVCSWQYLGIIPTAIAAITIGGGYCFSIRNSVNGNRTSIVHNNINKELFRRLPQKLKEKFLSKTQFISNNKIATLENYQNEPDLERLRKITIQSCLENRIDKKIMGHILLHCMAKEIHETIPGIDFLSTHNQSRELINKLVTPFSNLTNIPSHILGDPTKIEDAFLVVQMNQPLDGEIPYHYTLMVAEKTYPFVLTSPQTGQRRIYVFSPHIFEQIMKHRYEMPEKPLFVLGTKSVERLSDNTQRVLAMTGGKTIPTPNIEANEALSLTFYIHDCYHIDIDSAIGKDRILWNAFGKHLLNHSKQIQDPDMKIAFAALSEFCLDKEFEVYKKLKSKNIAFLTTLLGIFSIAGQHATEDKNDPFKMIRDAAFVKEAQQAFLNQFKVFLAEEVPQPDLRADLTKDQILQSLDEFKGFLKEQDLTLPRSLEVFIKTIQIANR